MTKPNPWNAIPQDERTGSFVLMDAHDGTYDLTSTTVKRLRQAPRKQAEELEHRVIRPSIYGPIRQRATQGEPCLSPASALPIERCAPD